MMLPTIRDMKIGTVCVDYEIVNPTRQFLAYSLLDSVIGKVDLPSVITAKGPIQLEVYQPRCKAKDEHRLIAALSKVHRFMANISAYS